MMKDDMLVVNITKKRIQNFVFLILNEKYY